jgi:predicted porin
MCHADHNAAIPIRPFVAACVLRHCRDNVLWRACFRCRNRGRTGLGTTCIDMRQVFLTSGNESMGMFKLGRNIGLFGADAILNDMTLPGVGAGESNLDLASGEASSNLVETNKKYTLGAYYLLTENLTLIGEFTDTKAGAHNGVENDSSNFNLGAYLSF